MTRTECKGCVYLTKSPLGDMCQFYMEQLGLVRRCTHKDEKYGTIRKYNLKDK